MAKKIVKKAATQRVAKPKKPKPKMNQSTIVPMMMQKVPNMMPMGSMPPIMNY